ncbi:MAG: sugar transferase [Clostridiales bacterium]|nr:sugar transferase [Clostridiales bacterium]
MYRRFIKRPLDIVCAALAMLVFCWLYGIIAVLVRIKLGSPILFKQPRPGKGEKIFLFYKFRTMTDARDGNGALLPDSERLTKFGRFLRKSSLDELPEAINILKGDMSVVGPRPLLVEYLPLYNEEQKKRHSVRPGLTGLAQVNGRNALSWQEKFAFDVQYAARITFWGDVKIICKTVQKAFIRQEGINQSAQTTMRPFTGNDAEAKGTGHE